MVFTGSRQTGLPISRHAAYRAAGADASERPRVNEQRRHRGEEREHVPTPEQILAPSEQAHRVEQDHDPRQGRDLCSREAHGSRSPSLPQPSRETSALPRYARRLTLDEHAEPVSGVMQRRSRSTTAYFRETDTTRTLASTSWHQRERPTQGPGMPRTARLGAGCRCVQHWAWCRPCWR